jgi:hypothetical protein
MAKGFGYKGIGILILFYNRKVDCRLWNAHNQGADLTNLTFIKGQISIILKFSRTLIYYKTVFLTKTILLKTAVVPCVLGMQKVKNEKKSRNFICI